MHRVHFFLSEGAVVARVVVPARGAVEGPVAGRRAADIPRGRDCILEIGQKGVWNETQA